VFQIHDASDLIKSPFCGSVINNSIVDQIESCQPVLLKVFNADRLIADLKDSGFDRARSRLRAEALQRAGTEQGMGDA
jgi:hypothetical protein